MLTLQRASAGSGKTYTLAQKYILNLIAYKTEDKKWHLRNERQIDDALLHILAITFTNKATNEMKQRIISNLSTMAKAEDILRKDPEAIKDIPYILFFKELTGATVNEISLAAKYALKAILNNFSFFKISTIDSFFQEILRIFTYEANLNDSYQLEIDSKFINDSALDTALHELDTRPENMGDSIKWLRIIMQRKAENNRGWNIFSKSTSKDSLYFQLRQALTKLEKEDFKMIKDRLDQYFKNPLASSELLKTYEKLLNLKNKEKEQLFNEIKTRLQAIRTYLDDPSFPKEYLKSHFEGHLKKIDSLIQEKSFDSFSYESIKKSCTVLKGKGSKMIHPINDEAMSLYNLLDQWYDPLHNPYRTAWKVYGGLIPYLGLILEIRKYISQVLERHNLIQLSDTSYILKKIIGEDDTPFVYERLGNRIDNYLIDEFQDTSQLQWVIIKPLLAEGLAKGKESLIIGDPKQSIYRFRNANHKLISKTVPEAFEELEEKGDSVADNTNWRSLTRIVYFNNYLFRNMALEVKSLSLKNNGTEDFLKLYSNVVQYPHNQEGTGYVEVRFLDEENSPVDSENNWLKDNEIDNTDESNDILNGNDNWDYNLAVLNQVAPLVSNLIERGYQSKDIAILVAKNFQGKKIVESFLNYNETLKDPLKKINFISEESLMVSSSPIVSIILNVMELMTRHIPNLKKEGIDNNTGIETENKKSETPQCVKWNDIKVNYELYSLRHKEMSPTERIMTFLNKGDTQDHIAELMADVQTPTLSSLVESIIMTFTDEKMRRTEALYITSFQDLVSEFSAGHNNDIATFLEWWKSKGKDTSVSSPSALNAVQIMTIHKSKGLEFKCVIVPFATDSFPPGNQQEEWRWVEPMLLDEITFPPFLPVATTAPLKESIHASIFNEYYDQCLTDVLNLYYVAFTRAKNELYIFTKKNGKTSTAGAFIKSILSEEEVLERLFSNEEFQNIPDPSDFIKTGDIDKITYGEPLTKEQIENQAKKEREKDKSSSKNHNMEGYFVNKNRPKLRSIAAKVLPSGELMK